jgi:sugar transferase (PEP-CTERM system associated)
MHTQLLLIAGDTLLSIVAVYAARLVRLGSLEDLFALDLQRLVVFAVVAVISSYFLELYNHDKRYAKKELLLRIVIALMISFLLLTSVYYMMGFVMFWRGLFVLSLVFFGVVQFLWHAGYAAVMQSSGLAHGVIVLGTGPLAKKIGDLILSTNHQHTLKGYVNMTGESVQVPAGSIISNSNGNGDGLVQTVREKKAHKLVVSLSERRGVFPLQDVLNCKFSGVEVVDAPSFYEEITGKLLIENTTPSWFIFSNGFKMTSSRRFYKRIADIMCSLTGLALTTPLLPLVALMIKMDSRGPVFLRQVRVGEMEKKFILYKFRTMRQDAEKGTGAVWAQKNDPRVTRVGRLLRKIRIDEVPQLFNVLKGEMSFIGPRPERPEFVGELKKIIPYYSERHFVKPGVTGWAQIRYPYGASIEDAVEKLRYDLYYIKNISLLLDMLIVLETIKVVLFGRGGR